ncbi:MAG: zinc-binding dehydrogenase [Chloroflexi bacterium]|nr:zinc-binding dehydrogenase [Chloroflexota bacterium]
MKAAVFYGAKDIRVENVADPKIEPTDVLVRVKACGVCGSDVHTYKKGILSRPGFVMGHELSGEVIEVGKKVKDVKIGDRVVTMIVPNNETIRGCGQCFWCLRGQPQWCTSITHKPCGECGYCKSGQFWMCDKIQRHMLIGYGRNGGFAEYVLVPDAVLNNNIFKIPDSLSWAEATFIEPLWGAYRWVMLAEPKPYETAVVMGLGTIGLLVMQVLKQYLSKVIVSEVSQKRLRLAKELGADIAIDAAKENPLQRVIEITGTGRSFSGKGGGCADIVMECSGVPIVVQQAIEMTRTGGRIVLVGLFEEEVPITINRIIHKQLNLISSFNRGRKTISQEIMESMALLTSGKVSVKPLISHAFSLDSIMEAFEIQTKPEQSIKVLIKP